MMDEAGSTYDDQPGTKQIEHLREMKKTCYPDQQFDEEIEATFAGPSCDSLDIMFRGRMTVPLEVGDLLLVPACGAYSSASATVFNGFRKTQIVIWEDVKVEFGLEEALAAAV